MDVSCFLQPATTSRWCHWTNIAIRFGRDRVLFAIPKLDDLQPTADAPLYDVMPDGEHFVFLLDQSSARPQFNIILNWFEELKPSRPSK